MNKILKTIASAAILFSAQFAFSQTPGDTSIVQGFNFNSLVRDTQITFPVYDADKIERIWMKYTMRCKDGLISTSSNRNRGCGEWDYSCNTYIVDSTRIDSTKATIDKYFVYPQASADNQYSTTPTFNIYDYEGYDVQITSTTSESSFPITAGGTETSPLLSHQIKGGKSFTLLTAAHLSSLTVGDINALSLFSNGSTLGLNHLKIQMKEVPFLSLDSIPYADLTGGDTVYQGDWNLVDGENKIPFFQPYQWAGGNLLIEITSSTSNGSAPIALTATDISAKQSLHSNANQFAQFFPGNYIKVPGYLGVTGSTDRTIEAWVKTTGTEVDVMSWGESQEGGRFTVKIDQNGRPRVEVHNGSVEGNQVVNDGEWHHIAISLTGISLTGTKFYVDGALVNSINMNNVVVNTGAHNEVEISRGDWNNYFNGGMDDIRIWSSALDPTTIAKYFNTRVDSDHPNYADLELNYVFDGSSSTVTDLSPNGNNGEFLGGAIYGTMSAGTDYFDFVPSTIIPDITLHQADYVLDISTVTKQDSVVKDNYIVVENYFSATTGFDSDISSNYLEYYPKAHTHFSMTSNDILSDDLTTIVNSTIDYFRREPSQLELLSLVTPYGIGLDLGDEGVAWYFDVTDFYPVLKGNRGLRMTRGGEWQEDIDIQFLFVHGTPTREVLDMRQIWKVGHNSYADIQANKVYEPRTIELPSNTDAAKVRSAITGHGQEGEFIPRQHSLNINSGALVNTWQVWKACAENPIYPQGGTWVYDRAGWCPGMPTQMEEWDVTGFINNDQVEVDYSVAPASGDSRYIVNHQIVAYGTPNFTTDARIVMVEAPNNAISFGRINPTCYQPKIVVQNNGTAEITSLKITYKINDGTEATFDWTGSLSYLAKESISLPVPAGFWTTAVDNQSNKFTATISTVNGAADEYALNNTYNSMFEVVEIMQPEFVLEVKTNSKGYENNYRIEDLNGNVILERNSLSNNTVYTDTLQLTAGCYRYFIEDAGNNGISWWANNDGTGYMRFKTLTGSWIKNMEADFGGSYAFEFSVTQNASLENQTIYTPTYNLYPIPANEVINIDIKGNEEGTYTVYNAYGQTLEGGSISALKDNPEISIKGWDKAIYFIHFNTENQTIVKKFIKN
ncbi:LamG-like jellyroll fold domain-containing protein [Brumimicrobium sp.]|uniref:LamG-like jellyroll fold domain-containing protein n=1 Tax=Brumimicrobium sp. TaxID=2029867 RepID=UPI003A8FA0B1